MILVTPSYSPAVLGCWYTAQKEVEGLKPILVVEMSHRRWVGLFLALRRWQEVVAWGIFSQPASGSSLAPKHDVTSFQLLETIILLQMLLEHKKLLTNQRFKCSGWILVFVLVQVYRILVSSKAEDMPITQIPFCGNYWEFYFNMD